VIEEAAEPSVKDAVLIAVEHEQPTESLEYGDQTKTGTRMYCFLALSVKNAVHIVPQRGIAVEELVRRYPSQVEGSGG
jgi:hypothetical protein